jgi:two-component system OmpR family sensor kinase
MTFNSIKNKITIIFFISFILFIATFLGYLEYEKKQFIQILKNKYTKISDHIHQNRLRPHEIKDYVKSYNLSLTQNPKKLKNNSELVFQGRGYSLLKQKDRYYFHMETPHFRIMFDDLNVYEQSSMKYFVFAVVLALLLFIYFLIVKNIKQTDLLLESRQLFLRTVMHELKTPIAKGRIVSELIEDEKQKNRMITIFEKLNLQIDDFAKVEKIVSHNYNVNKSAFYINIIVNNAIDLLLLDNIEDKIIIENLSSQKLLVDLSLFSMAIKNLLDNGLKYSLDKKVILRQESNKLLFITQGEKLQKPLQDYFKPFHNDTKSKNHGMGLGLYIVKSILDIHGFSFEYTYEDNCNIFKIIL